MIRFNVAENSIKMYALSQDKITFAAQPATVVHGEGASYEGTYRATPRWDTQTLPTKGKYLREDVVIDIIPVEKVSNAAGGKTVIIGG